MELNSYPTVKRDFPSYSPFQLHKLGHLPHGKFYLGGRLIKTQNGIELWTQQARFQIVTKAQFEWLNQEGKIGDWVAVLLDSQYIKNFNSNSLETTSESVRILFLNSSGELKKPSANAEDLRFRSKFLKELKNQLILLGLEEIETPYLVPNPGMEPSLEPFATEWKWGSETKKYFLPTSPELHLKKMLVRGWSDIFEIKTCFRNSELTETHQPEFLMLEWYRAFHNLDQIKKDIQNILTGLHHEGLIIGDVPRLIEFSYAELFQRFLQFELIPETTKSQLEQLCAKNKIHYTSSDSWDDLFFRLSLERIEPQLENLGPIILKDFPPSQAALARLTDTGWADRFEFYWRGLEIANAFHELNDPQEQKIRFSKEIELRKQIGTAVLEPDKDFLEHLEAGMPPSSGIALGVDRLLMAAQQEKQISRYRAFEFTKT